MGVFWLFFYENIFRPRHNSAIIIHKNPNENNVHTLLNELFSINKKRNERTLKENLVNKNIKFG